MKQSLLLIHGKDSRACELAAVKVPEAYKTAAPGKKVDVRCDRSILEDLALRTGRDKSPCSRSAEGRRSLTAKGYKMDSLRSADSMQSDRLNISYERSSGSLKTCSDWQVIDVL